MAVEHLSPDVVRDLLDRVAAARRAASEELPETRADADDPHYWQRIFEVNAAALLNRLPRVRLSPGHTVRYRFFGRQRNEFLIRPFITRTDTDPTPILHLIDWHAPPDTARTGESAGRDVELLYSHFTFEPSAAGAFEYWLAMQELWASQRWIHSTIIADSEQFAQLTSTADWEVDRPVERVEPAVVRDPDGTQIAVLVYCPLQRHMVTFHRVRIAPDQSIEFAESILVAHGPRGYIT